MNATQRALARHALGLPNDRRRSYRNRFVTGEGSTDFGPWLDMVVEGLARRIEGGLLISGDDLFMLTFTGATAALAPGEKLDAEDFPEAGEP